MGEEITFENGRISDFQGLVTWTLTLDRVILHTIMHHSSTSTYIPSFVEIEETFCGRTHVRTGGRTFQTHFIRSTRKTRPKNVGWLKKNSVCMCVRVCVCVANYFMAQSSYAIKRSADIDDNVAHIKSCRLSRGEKQQV